MKSDEDVSGCGFYLVLVVCAAVVMVALLNRLDRQENWIRDLQRRIAVLEQSQK